MPVNQLNKKSTIFKLHKARFHMLMKYSFFGSLALGLKLTEYNASKTMSTNGKEIRFNKDFVETKNTKDLIFILMHEIGHIIFMHHIRHPANVNFDLWNVAGDYVVNALLIDEHKVPISSMLRLDCLYDERFDGMTTEMVYRILLSETSDQPESSDSSSESSSESSDSSDSSSPDPSGQSNQSESCDQSDQSNPSGSTGQSNQSESYDQSDQSNPSDSTGQTKLQDLIEKSNKLGKVEKLTENLKEEEQKLSSDIMSSHKISGNMASQGIPNFVKIDVEKTTTTKQNWQNILRDYFNLYSQSDTSYKEPDRRFSGHDVIMPSMKRLDSCDFVIVIDVSPSVVSADELKLFVSQARHLMDDIDFQKLYVIYCADVVTGYQEFSKEDDIKLEYSSGWGTSFYPAFEEISKLNISPACVVYFTDMEAYNEDYGPAPAYPVIWASYKKGSAELFLGENLERLPFGIVLNLDLKEVA